jgi:inner membrane protein
MDFNFEVWHWLVLGFVLMVFEVFSLTFAALWFGVAAMMMSILLWLMPLLSNTVQVLIWLILSVLLAVAWFKWIKPLSIDRTKAGLGRELVIGQIGFMVHPPQAGQTGLVRFTLPVMGSDEWVCRSDVLLSIGDRVQVTDVVGNELLVRPIGSK